jgi:chromosome segregation ATPase
VFQDISLFFASSAVIYNTNEGISKMDEIQRFTAIKEKLDKLEKDKIRIEERFNNEKSKLDEVLKEISAKGYDPNKLSEILAAKQTELNAVLTEIEKTTAEITQQISSIETTVL